jgi:hypothetical protein
MKLARSLEFTPNQKVWEGNQTLENAYNDTNLEYIAYTLLVDLKNLNIEGMKPCSRKSEIGTKFVAPIPRKGDISNHEITPVIKSEESKRKKQATGREVKDPIRTTIEVTDYNTTAEQAITQISEYMQICGYKLDEVYPSLKSGYSDIKLYYKKDGVWIEIQINYTESLQVKTKDDKFYKQRSEVWKEIYVNKLLVNKDCEQIIGDDRKEIALLLDKVYKANNINSKCFESLIQGNNKQKMEIKEFLVQMVQEYLDNPKSINEYSPNSVYSPLYKNPESLVNSNKEFGENFGKQIGEIQRLLQKLGSNKFNRKVMQELLELSHNSKIEIYPTNESNLVPSLRSLTLSNFCSMIMFANCQTIVENAHHKEELKKNFNQQNEYRKDNYGFSDFSNILIKLREKMNVSDIIPPSSFTKVPFSKK